MMTKDLYLKIHAQKKIIENLKAENEELKKEIEVLKKKKTKTGKK